MNRQAYREMMSKHIGASTTLSFRACRILDTLNLRDKESIVAWLNKPSTRRTRSLGIKTFWEICSAMGMAVPANAPTTLGDKLRVAEAKLEKVYTALNEALNPSTGLEDTCLYLAGLTADGVELGEYERQGIQDYGRHLVRLCLADVMEVAK
jgi:hypothetical protein